MGSYNINTIKKILNARAIIVNNSVINSLIYDSRSLVSPIDSLFFALKGKQRDGHAFIKDLYNRNIRNFVVNKLPADREYFAKANFLIVEDTLLALQKVAQYHREQFNGQVVGITGSNGKTIIKEWLFHMLYNKKKVVSSPKSYNSAIGVPLSIWLLDESHETGVFEAGISFPGEMEILYNIIKPDIGIFTNIGDAHQENFSNLKQKVNEKLLLFKSCNTLIYNKDNKLIHEQITKNENLKNVKLFRWSLKGASDIQITEIISNRRSTKINGIYNRIKYSIIIPFTDKASIENAIHVWAYLLNQQIDNKYIKSQFIDLPPVAMRLELREGINSCTIINDSYNSDIGSLAIALDLLNQQNQHDKKTLILSDILQSGYKESDLYSEVAKIIKIKNINRFIGIGDSILKNRNLFPDNSEFYKSTENLLSKFNSTKFNKEAILLKGARVFQFERISGLLEKKSHRTVMEINLSSMLHNLNYYKSLVSEKTGIIAVVKAFSYGTGSYEIANLLQYHGVSYLAVAYTDEGVQLRKAGINIPILVMNPNAGDFSKLIDYNLEPEIFSFRTLSLFIKSARKNSEKIWPVHIKINTGMNRLGFGKDNLPDLVYELKKNNNLKVSSVFSHLAAVDDKESDEFTRKQISLFEDMSQYIQESLNYPVSRHLLNSSGIEKFPEAAYDFVRIGIGLYGTANDNNALKNVCTLKTSISQINIVHAGESIGYNRLEKVITESKIAILPIGYADGLSRRLGNRKGKVLINSKFVPIVGDLCMDMLMVDITEITAKEGDIATIFSEKLPVGKLAKQIDTIPYEILSGISARVKRVYITE